MNIQALLIGAVIQFPIIHVIAVLGTCQVPSSYNPNPDEILDYYWREYRGIIPKDAIVGGLDQSDNPTYIGQAFVKVHGVLPAIIYSGCKSVEVTASSKVLTPSENIKVLCSKNKESFEWVPTSASETHLLTDLHLVEGGSEVHEVIYIGRVRQSGRLLTGKVFIGNLNRGLWIPYMNEEVNFLTFEILAYNPKKNADASINIKKEVTLTINMWYDYCG